MFSYGSGLTATLFSFKIREGQHPFSLSNIATVMNVGGKLKSRHEVSFFLEELFTGLENLPTYKDLNPSYLLSYFMGSSSCV